MAISTSLVCLVLILLQTIYSVQAGIGLYFEITSLLPVFSFFKKTCIWPQDLGHKTTSYIQELDLHLPSNC